MTSKQLKLVADLREILSSDAFISCFDQAVNQNQWFTRNNIEFSVETILETMLDVEKVEHWLNQYVNISDGEDQQIGIVMAGNIPLVGFFDLFCTLITGCRVVIKLSSKDSVLMGCIVENLQKREWTVSICEKMPTIIDKLITMGGEDAAEYYGSQFANIPTLIRSHRYSVAILTGDETTQELNGLLEDMFRYWGLGCRNVTMLYLPQGYDLECLPNFMTDFKPFVDNYRYNKALYMMRCQPFIDKQGYLLINNDQHNSEPAISVVKYDYYKSDVILDNQKIQCVVTNSKQTFASKVSISESQKPTLFDYPDAKDVIKFLING